MRSVHRFCSRRARDSDRSRPKSAFETTTLARIVSPDASATPLAAPSSTRIDLDLLPAAHLSALRGDQVGEAGDELARAAHCEMHAPALFQEGDQAVDRAGAKRVAADEQRMKTEDGPKPFVTKIFRDETVDAAVALEPDEIAGDARHVADGVERRVAQLLETDPVDGFAMAHEAFEPRKVARIESRDFGPHRRFVAAHREDVAVLEADLVEGVIGRRSTSSSMRRPQSAHSSSNRNGAVTIVGPASKVKPS